MSEVSVWLPFPPSVNNLFSQGIVKGKVRRFPSKPYKRWREEAVIRLLAAKLPPFTEPIVVKLELTPRDSRPRDADNYSKAVIDALVSARLIPGDDSRWIKAVVAYWENPSALHGVRITIRHAKMAGQRVALNAAERKLLERVTSAGTLLVRPTFISGIMRGLVDKGYVRELPGLLAGIPQGFTAIEAIRGEKTAQSG